jgi:hypothetical protein
LVCVIAAPVFRYHSHVRGDYLRPGARLVHITDNLSEAARAPVGDSILADPGTACGVLADLVSKATRSLPAPIHVHRNLRRAQPLPRIFMPDGPTGLPPWPDFLVRLTRLPVASIRGRATGNGSEITLACDMSFARREKAIISQWEVGVGMVAGGGPMARLPRLIGRNRALEVLLSSEDIRADQAEACGYINRALPDADPDASVEALATRIAGFDKWAIANTKRLVNTSLPPDVELDAGWDAYIASLGRPAAQEGIKALMERGFHKPGDVENRLGYYLAQIAR